jgi:polar amino acid transport system substrate-binding protein
VAPAARAAAVAPPEQRPLRVITFPVPPFVLPHVAPLAGFSVDLWNELARRMGVRFTWNVASTPAQVLQAVARGDADAAIAAIAITAERARVVDFSHPYFDSGLRIMVRSLDEGTFLSTLLSIPWSAIGHLFAAAIVLVFLLANVLWVLERRANDRFHKGYLRAIGEGVWGIMLIIATGEYGDRDAPYVAKRVAVVAVWLLGVVLIAQLTATVTSTQTIERLHSSIRGPDDLAGKTIASVPGTAAGAYLTRRALRFVAVTSGSEAVRMLTTGEVQAIVFDAPVLQYIAAKQEPGLVEVVGPLFGQEKYGIAVAAGSPLRARINLALLELVEDGTYEQLYAKWFAPNK